MSKIKRTTKPINDNLASFLSLDEMEETKNILEYRFLFDLSLDKSFIAADNLMEIFHTPIFSVNLAFNIPSNLLGVNNFEINHYKTMYESIYKHCIISALHTIKYLIWKEKGEPILHGTSAARYIDESYDSFETKVRNFFRPSFSSTMITNMDFAYSLLGKSSTGYEENNLEIPAYNLNLYNHIIQNKKFFLKSKDKPNMRIDRFIELMNLYQDISTINEKGKSVDNLLLQYQLERYFNASLFEYLYQKHKHHRDNPKNPVMLSGDGYLSVIENFSLLPNAFSRNIFVDWAYESISDENREKIFVNYFNSPDEMKFGMITNEETNREDLKFSPLLKTPNMSYGTWLNTVECAIEYLSTVTFPMYEKTFFIILYKAFEKENRIKIDILEKMEEVLQEYCIKEFVTSPQTDYCYKQPSFDKWNNYSENRPSKDEIEFYLKLLNEMLDKTNLQSLYRIKLTREYFIPSNPEYVPKRAQACIDYYQRQFMYLNNVSTRRDIYL